MVLRHIVLLALLLAGCKQSLFDNGNGGYGDDQPDAPGSGDGGTDGMVQSTCGAGCIADSAADFGTSKWEYLDDHRDRTWAGMTASGGMYVGANAENKFALVSGRVLVSTAGHTDPADPAMAYTSTVEQTIKLSFTVDIPATAPSHTVRLYRNSREDVLFTKIGLGGDQVSTSIVVDALAGDRFMLALAPNNSGGSALEVSFFVNETATGFPSECQVALQFLPSTTNTTPNPCGQAVTFYHNDGGNSYTAHSPMSVLGGPFTELGSAAEIPTDYLFSGAAPLLRSGDTTTQFWIQHHSLDSTYDTVLFSDEDCDTQYGGLLVYRHPNGTIGAESCTGPSASKFGEGSYPAGTNTWHFVRVVHTGGNVNLCIDGTKIATYALPTGGMHTAYNFELGQNNDYAPVVAVLDAAMDDVRVLSTALPCE